MKLLALFCTLLALVASHKSYHGHKVGGGRRVDWSEMKCEIHILLCFYGIRAAHARKEYVKGLWQPKPLLGAFLAFLSGSMGRRYLSIVWSGVEDWQTECVPD